MGNKFSLPQTSSNYQSCVFDHWKSGLNNGAPWPFCVRRFASKRARNEHWRGGMMKGQTIRTIRQVHNYVGMFFAPAILFFSISGAFQVLGMHEDRGHGQPMPWVAWMASVHKDQQLPHAWPEGGGQKPGAGGPEAADQGKSNASDHHPQGPDAHGGPPHHPDGGFSVLKAFVLCMALGLISSASLGIVIAFTNPNTRRLNSAIIAAGALLPVALLLAL
jgi:hypothetical protein